MRIKNTIYLIDLKEKHGSYLVVARLYRGRGPIFRKLGTISPVGANFVCRVNFTSFFKYKSLLRYKLGPNFGLFLSASGFVD
jgi:hypothetical protein